MSENTLERCPYCQSWNDVRLGECDQCGERTDEPPENAPSKQVDSSDLLALSHIREIVGDENHILTNNELIEDIKMNYIKPVKQCEIPSHLRGEQLAKKTIRERDNLNLANMLSKAERKLANLIDLINEEVIDEIYNPRGENEDLLKRLKSLIS